MLFLGSLLCATVLLTSSAPLMERLPEKSPCYDGLCFVYPEACPILDCKIILKIDLQSDNFANFMVNAEQDSSLDNVLMLAIDNDNGLKTTYTCYPEEQRATVINEVDGQIEEIGTAQLLSSGMDIDLQCDLTGPLINPHESIPDKYIVSLGNFDGRTTSVSNEYALYPFVAEEYLPFMENTVSAAALPGLPFPLALESEQDKPAMQKKETLERDITGSSVDPRDSQASVQHEQFEATEGTRIEDAVVEKSLSPSGASTTIKPAASTAAVNSSAADIPTSTASVMTSSNKSSVMSKDDKKSEKDTKKSKENLASSANSTRVHTTTMAAATTTARNTTSSTTLDKNLPSMRSMDSDLESDEETAQEPLETDRNNSTTEVPTKSTSDRSDPDEDDTIRGSSSACSVASLLLSVISTYYLM